MPDNDDSPKHIPHLNTIQARVLACLMEKQETTPDQYPLTLNALRNACNQKSARHPVTDFAEGEVGHAVRELEALDLVREEWGARTSKYSHRVGPVLGIHRRGIALLCVLMLRGPQTPGELKTHCQRLFPFDDLDDVVFALGKLETHEPPLITALPRQPGQKEGRYAHLLSGEAEASATVAPSRSAPADMSTPDLRERVAALEASLLDMEERLVNLEQQEAG